MSQSSPLILLHPDDNVLVCRLAIQSGQTVMIDGDTRAIAVDIGVGHKVARHALKAGDKIMRYGVPIGSLTKDAQRGDHIHLHNLKSDYISTHTREATGHDH